MSLDLNDLEALAVQEREPEIGFVLTYPPLYKRDSKGKLRIWYVQRQDERHRVLAGLVDGALTPSGWTVCKSKGKGKAQTSPEQQAIQEVQSKYQHELDREYFDSPEGADGPPRFFKPQLAQKWTDFGATLEEQWAGALKRLEKAGYASEHGNGIYSEPKLDGYCCIAQASGLTSREGQPIVAVPHVMEALQPLFAQRPDAVFHGELYNHELRNDFETLGSILKKVKGITPEQATLARSMAQYHIYDYADPEVRDLRFSRRRIALYDHFRDLLGRAEPVVHVVETSSAVDAQHLEQLRLEVVGLGYEGQMVKLDLGPYEQKRSWSVLKRKVFDDAEFDVVEIVEGEGNYAGYAKRVTCWLPDADRSTGPNKTNTFGAGIKGKRDEWLAGLLHDETQRVVTIRHFGWTGDGKPRMGVAIKWHGEARTL